MAKERLEKLRSELCQYKMMYDKSAEEVKAARAEHEQNRLSYNDKTKMLSDLNQTLKNTKNNLAQANKAITELSKGISKEEGLTQSINSSIERFSRWNDEDMAETCPDEGGSDLVSLLGHFTI